MIRGLLIVAVVGTLVALIWLMILVAEQICP